MGDKITNQEILQAINAFSSDVDKKFGGIDKKFEGIDKKINKIQSLMVTKDYLDEKFSDFRGDLVVLMRKEDVKLNKLVDILEGKKIITNKEAQAVLSMEPFPKLSL